MSFLFSLHSCWEAFYSILSSKICGIRGIGNLQKLKARAVKAFAFLLSFFSVFSVLIFPVAAASSFNTYDMSIKGVGNAINGSTVESIDITKYITVSKGSYSGENCTVYTIPASPGYLLKSVIAFNITDLNSEHEYNIKFKYNSGLPASSIFSCDLVFYSSNGTELKRQQLVYNDSLSSGWSSADIDFKPDNSGLSSGYKSKIEFSFLTSTESIINFRLSETVELTDKDDDSGWFQQIINAIKEIPEKIGNFFSSLGESIKAAIDNIKDWLSELGDKISEKFQEIADSFSEFFEKFKPRVYIDFNWQRGNINTVTGEIIGVNNDKLPRVIISDFFTVNSSDKYLLDVIDNTNDSTVFYFGIFQYDLNNNFIQYYPLKPTTEYSLPSGYNYRFAYSLSSNVSNDVANDYVLCYADEGWLSAFGNYILNAIKNFFIPADGFFDEMLTNFKAFFAEHFGIVYTAGDISVEVITRFADLTPPDEAVLSVPKWQMRLPFENDKLITLVNETEVNFSDYINSSGVLHSFYTFYRAFVTFILIFLVINYAKRKFDYVFGKDGEGV